MKPAIQLSEDRKRKVFDDLSHGSHPRSAFFLLVAVSTFIAAFGLVMNSTAVVIGAMLVAPLMTPILGLALALVRGDPKLLGMASRSEALGVVVSVSAGAIVGLVLPSTFEATPEMLARISPNLLDLLVAIFAGLAGAYALVDERLSPALPGVAISTAIVPPLANSGMCISLGAFDGALGSFFLFFTNFLSILLISALIFHLSGMGGKLKLNSGLRIVRRFGIATLSLAAVGILLSFELIKLFEDQRLRIELTQTLRNELGRLRVVDLERLAYEKRGDALFVLADVNAPRVVNPRAVEAVQGKLSELVDEPVELYVRTVVTHDVSASGLVHQSITETLDGVVAPSQTEPQIVAVQTAEQIIREYLDDKLGVHLENVYIYSLGNETFLVAEMAGVRHLRSHEVGELEDLIKNRLEQMSIRLLVRQESVFFQDRLGPVRTEFSMPRPYTPEEQVIADTIAAFLRDWFVDKPNWFESLSVTVLDSLYYVLVEVKGPASFSSDDFNSLSQDLAKAVATPVELFVHSELEAVMGRSGYTSLGDLLTRFRERNRAAYPEAWGELIREAK